MSKEGGTTIEHRSSRSAFISYLLSDLLSDGVPDEVDASSLGYLMGSMDPVRTCPLPECCWRSGTSGLEPGLSGLLDGLLGGIAGPRDCC